MFLINHLDIYGDSELVVRQMTTGYKARRLFECLFDRQKNYSYPYPSYADALANFATALAINKKKMEGRVSLLRLGRFLVPGVYLSFKQRRERRIQIYMITTMGIELHLAKIYAKESSLM